MTTTLTLARPLTAWELRATSPKARQQMKALLDEYTDAPALYLSARRWARDYSSAKRNSRHATRCRRKKTPSMAAADRRLPMTMLHWGSASNSHSPRTAIRAWTWPRAARGDPCQRRAVSGRRGDSRRSSSGDLPHVLGDPAAGSDVPGNIARGERRHPPRAWISWVRRDVYVVEGSRAGDPASGRSSSTPRWSAWASTASVALRGAARDRGRRVPPEPGVAVQGPPVSEPVLGVAVGARRRGRR